MILETYKDTEMPHVSFYDNNCMMNIHVNSSPIDVKAFSRTLLPVDPFHFKSHKESHLPCRLNNDPNLFPELKTEDGRWVFNGSAAEVINVWLGGFESMVRNMHAVRYHFFLNEMVRLRNIYTVEKLKLQPNVKFLGNLPVVTRPQ